jgi:hypothetical protein
MAVELEAEADRLEAIASSAYGVRPTKAFPEGN